MPYPTPHPLEFSGSPLANDDRRLSNPSPIEFTSSPGGLDLAGRPAAPLGLQGMPNIDVNTAIAQFQAAGNAPLANPGSAASEAQIFYSPSTGRMVVNGSPEFSQENASAAVQSRQWLDLPRRQFTLPDTATDWREMTRSEYERYMADIEHPTLGRRFSEGRENAWRGMGDIALGAALAVNPDWEWAQRARADIQQEYVNNAPFMLRMADVQTPEDGLAYIAQMAAQAEPWLIETFVSMGIGALAGGAVSGGVGAPAGAVEGFIAKEALKRAAQQLIRQNLRRGALAYERALAERGVMQHAATMTREEVARYAARTGVASADDVNRFFNFGERAYHLSRGSGTLTRGAGSGNILSSFGAVGGAAASNYFTGVGDIRNSIVDAGGDARSADAIANIWGLAVPYAFVESMGDLLLTQPLTRIIPGLNNGPTRLGNIARGFGLTAAGEGAEEGAQYVITQQGVAGATQRPIDVDPYDLLENVVGGAIAGGAMGGLVGGLAERSRPVESNNAGGPVPSGPLNGPESSGTAVPGFQPGVLEDGNGMGGYNPDLNPDYGSAGLQTGGTTAEEQAMRNNALRDLGTNQMPQEEYDMRNNALQDEGDWQISGQPARTYAPTPEEIQRLQAIAVDPNATPAQREAARSAMDAFQGSDERTARTMEAGDRYRQGAMGGQPVIQEAYPQSQVDSAQGIIDEGLIEQDRQFNAGLQARPEDRNNVDLPPGMTTLDRPARSRPVEELYKDLMTGEPLEARELQTLREAVHKLMLANPTNPVYGQAIDLIVAAENSIGKDTGKVDWNKINIPPTLGDAQPGIYQRPNDVLDQPIKAGPLPPIEYGPDGLPKYGQHRLKTPAGRAALERMLAEKDGLRGREQTAPDTPATPKESAEDMLARVYQLDARDKLSELSDDELNRAKQMTKLKRGKGAHGALHAKLQAETEARQVRKGGKNRKRAAKAMEKEGKGRFVQGSAIVTPDAAPEKDTREEDARDFDNKDLYPTPPENPKVEGDIGTAEVLPNAPEEQARFVTEDETLEVSWAEGGKIEMKAYTYYVYNGTPVRRDIYENTREPIGDSKFGQDGAFRKKAGIVFPVTRATKDGNIKTLESPTKGQNYKAGELVFVGWAGERWNQSETKAAKSYDLEIDEPFVVGVQTNRIKEAARRAKEANDAVQEPSTARVAKEEQARRVQTDRGTNTAEPAAAATQGTNESGNESVQGTEVDRKRLTKAKNALLIAASRETKDATQKALGTLNAMVRARKAGRKFKTEQAWLTVDGTQLTEAELRTLAQELEAEAEGNRATASFHATLMKAWDFDKENMPKFESFIKEHLNEAAAWVDTTPAKLNQKARSVVQRVLRDNPPPKGDVQAMAVGEGPKGRYAKTVTDILRQVLKDNPDFTFKSWHPATRERAREVMHWIHNAQQAAGEPLYDIDQMANSLIQVKKLMRRDAALAANPDNKTTKNNFGRIERLPAQPMKKGPVRRLLEEFQKKINPAYRYKHAYVFNDMKDMWSMADKAMMTAENGAEITLRRFILGEALRWQLENPSIANLSEEEVMKMWADAFLMSRAVVINAYNTIIVFNGHMENEREVGMTLEHEFIVHRGLSVLFPNQEDRFKFLYRLRTIPGMEEKRLALISQYPRYAAESVLSQIEEVLAFHAMEGPLALEFLLSHPAAMDPQTKRTLWDDFKDIIREFMNRIFGVVKIDGDEALNAVVEALREHAIMNSNPNLNAVLDDQGAMPLEMLEMLMKEDLEEGMNETKAAALVGTVSEAETLEALRGTKTEPNRPYKPDPWDQHARRILEGNRPLLEKLAELWDKNANTSMKEQLKKIGRNVESMGQMELRSTLIQKMMRIMHNTIAVARRIMSKRQETRTYATKSEELAGVRKWWGDKAPGSTQKQRDSASRLMIMATNHKLAQATEKAVRASPRLLMPQANGTFQISKDLLDAAGKDVSVFAALLKLGTVTREEFKKGIMMYTVTGDGKLTENGVATATEEMLNEGYDIYLQETKHMAESMVETLEHALIMLHQMNDSAVASILEDNKFSAVDEPFMKEALERMYKIYSGIAFRNYGTISRTARHKQKEMARQVLAEMMRTMHSQAKVDDWTDASRTRDSNENPRKNTAFKWRESANAHDDVKPFVTEINWFLQHDPATGMNRFQRMNRVYGSIDGQRQYEMLGVFQTLLNAETLAHEHENDVIQSILGNYFEMTRKGAWRVYFDVYYADGKNKGKRADIGPELLATLPVFYPNSQREAKQLQADLAEEFSGEFTIDDAEGNPIKVKFDIGYGKAPTVSTLAEGPKIKEFLSVAEIAKLKLSANQMKMIANLIENAATRKRYGLQRAGTPGMDLDVIRNNSETMTRRAWWAAKMSQAWMLDRVFADERNVYGDWDHLADLQRDFDIANRGAPMGSAPPTGFVRNEAKVYLAEARLLRYAKQLRHMSRHTLKRPEVVIRTTEGDKKFKIEPEAEAHREHAKALKESLERNELELNLNDLLSKTGPMRMMAVVMQLGTLASGIMNAFTLITHLPMVLTAKHGDTGYGEGFTTAQAVSAIMKATKDVFNPLKGWTESANVKEMLDQAKAGNNKSGMSIEELEFLYQETLDGLLMPQQTYSLTGGTESNISNLVMRNFSEALLGPFAGIEASNRRVSALATYRLVKERYMASGVAEAKLNDQTSSEYKQMVNDIERVVYNSQGDYANINRPKAFRGDLAQYVLMYKMFPLMTVQMLWNLPKKQQAAFLIALFILGGLKGEPFADDFMDLYDTLLQKLGFKHDSVELQMILALEKVMPGSSNWFMHGFVDTLAFGGTMSSRISMGDIVPMTGMFREGADYGREILNAFGPAYAANADIAEFAFTLADGFLQITGAKPLTMSIEDVIRAIPQAQIRGIGEAAIMARDGEIVDPRGRLVSDNVDIGTILSRAAGFYPLEASRANNAVRLDRMHTKYMQSVRARFILSYANAYRHNNADTMERIMEEVSDWNDAARESGREDMLIRNFRSAAVRAGRAAGQTTIERTSDGAPNYSLLDELAEIINADTESEDD